MAFQARLYNTGLLHPYFWLWDYTMELKEEAWHEPGERLPWAASWIQHCGEHMWWSLCQPHIDEFFVEFGELLWNCWEKTFYAVSVNPQASLKDRLLAHDSYRIMVQLADSPPNPKFDNKGQCWWNQQMQEMGTDGPWDVPTVEEYGSDEDDSEDDYYSDEESVEDPLMPSGGFLPYANVTEMQLNQIARAA